MIKILIVWYWHKDRNIDEWSKIESPKISPHIYSQLFAKRVPSKFNDERIVISTNHARTTGYPHVKI